MKYAYYIIVLFLFSGMLNKAFAQKYVFAQLSGSPVDTTGWDLKNSAMVSGSEIILTPNINDKLGSVFFTKAINLSQCITWSVEFDFRIYGGTAADGIAFCFLDAPPTAFKSGGNLGIPPTSNGLKICFDTYLNCFDTSKKEIPKIEMRWGVGYDECWAQPTAVNVNGNLDFLRSSATNHAKIEYNNGNINVYVNRALYLTGFQSFNFTGYFGFTASTGGSNDIQSISNAIIYTNIPPSIAGKDAAICSEKSLQIGTTNNPAYSYSWEPATGLNNTNISNPIVTLTNNTATPKVLSYIVTTSLTSSPSCNSKDTILITSNPIPIVSVNSGNICKGSTMIISATPSGPYAYSWTVPALAPIPGNVESFTTSIAGNYIVIIKDTLTSCISASSAGIVTVAAFDPPAVSITASSSTICAGSIATFTATPLNCGTSQSYQWKVNGMDVGFNSNTFSSADIVNGDAVHVVMTCNNPCINISSISSNVVRETVFPAPYSILGPDTTICEGENIILKTTNYYTKYLWNTNSVSPSIVIDKRGLYWLKVVDIHGCSAIDSIRVSSKLCAKGFFIPNAFTPDDNGLNDIFKPIMVGKVIMCQFIIYNKWGNEIFKSNDYKKGWDGKFKGVKQESGIYLWVCNFQFEGEEKRLEKGTTVLINK